jgi:hypothetical protein
MQRKANQKLTFGMSLRLITCIRTNCNEVLDYGYTPHVSMILQSEYGNPRLDGEMSQIVLNKLLHYGYTCYVYQDMYSLKVGMSLSFHH